MSLRDADNCPSCGVTLVGDPIPEELREDYGGATNFRLVIGISSLEKDRIVAWRCPHCGYEEERQWPES